MSNVQGTVPAGWYPDPYTGQQRWWDGAQWTQHYAPVQQATQPIYAVTNVQGGKTYKTSHGFHLLMSVITFGLWLPVWLIVGVYNASRNGH